MADAGIFRLRPYACRQGHVWWLALMVTVIASICERINSEFEFVKDRRRNRLGHEKANKLVAIFHNRRLLTRMKKPAYVEPAIGWNTEDERAGVIKYGVAN